MRAQVRVMLSFRSLACLGSPGDARNWAVHVHVHVHMRAVHVHVHAHTQVMLAIGLQQSQRSADGAHPYGYGFEQYVWAMISGVSTFILGAVESGVGVESSVGGRVKRKG